MTPGILDVVLPDPEERTPTILILEDEALIRLASSDFLQECRFNVLEAADGEEAVEIISHAINLVFSDMVMPGRLDGFRRAQVVASEPTPSHHPDFGR